MKARSRRSCGRRHKAMRPGCGLAFAALALVFAGVIGAGWLVVVVAVYALRWSKASRPRPVERPAEDERVADASPQRRAEDGGSDDAIIPRLDRLVAQARPHLPDDLVVHLYSLRCSISQALPWLAQRPSHDADLYTVRETVSRYLPDTLEHYLALPPAWRTAHVVQDGKTARQLLAEQLALLDVQMRGIASKVASHDVQALLANGRFLEARFGGPDFVSG